MGVVAVDASYGRSELMAPIRSFLDDWAQAFAQLYRPAFDEAQALERGRQLVADFEGAICWRASMASRAISMASPGERWSNWRASLRPPST